jgi:hypothetical protein
MGFTRGDYTESKALGRKLEDMKLIWGLGFLLGLLALAQEADDYHALSLIHI